MRDLPDLPEIPAVRTQALRLQNTLAKRLPAMPDLSSNPYMSGNPEAEEMEKYMQAIRTASDEFKYNDKIQRAKARAKNRSAQRASEGR